MPVGPSSVTRSGRRFAVQLTYFEALPLSSCTRSISSQRGLRRHRRRDPKLPRAQGSEIKGIDSGNRPLEYDARRIGNQSPQAPLLSGEEAFFSLPSLTRILRYSGQGLPDAGIAVPRARRKSPAP